MKFWCRHWYNVGGIVAIITGIVLAVIWNDIEVLRRVQILSFISPYPENPTTVFSVSLID